MKLIDPATGQAVWDSNDPNAGPVPPAPEGRQWVRVDEPGDTMAPRRTAPGILDIGNGVTERLAFLNQTFNPVEGIGSAMRAGYRMVAPDQSYWDRIAALGDMVSGVASIAAPIAAAKAIGVPAASAMMEGLLGFSPAGQAAGDTMRAVGRDVVERLNQPGQMPTVYSNPIPGVGRPPQDIEGTLQAKYPDVKLSISGSPERGYTLNKIDVPKGKRESGIGTAVMNDLVNLADQQGAVLKLSPSGDFGGSVPRLKDFYARFGFVQNKGRNADYAISESMYRNPAPAAPALPTPRNEAEAMARDILQLRAEGRAGEVTDQMRAAADPQYMYFNTPLPMDYASRMARADQYFPDTAYHSTGKNFQEFIPSEFRGASFFGPTPEGAARGASASANEGVGSGSTITMPVRVDTSRVEGLGAYGMQDMNEFRASLPDRIYTEAEVDALMASDMAPRYGNWTYFFDDLTDYDALSKFRDANPDAPIPEGIIKYKPKQPLSYGPGLRSDISGKQFAHYSEGMSERPISDYTKSIGNTGFTMMDESGLALAMTDPTRIRSRFALFDPEFRNLRNLSAGVGGAAVLTALGNDAEAGTPEAQIMDLVKQSGVSGAAQILGVSRRDIEEAISIAVPPSQWDQLVVGPQ